MIRARGMVFGIVLALLALAGGRVIASEVAQAMGAAKYKETKDGMYAWCGFPGPCATPEQAVVLLEKKGPAEVMVNESFSYLIQISNRSSNDLGSVTLEDAFPAGFILESVDPQPQVDLGGKYRWDIGPLPAKAAKRITVTGRAMQTGCLVSTSAARVCFDMPLPIAIRVVQCNIELKQTLPAVSDLCEPIPMCLTVWNTGSAPATNVRIEDKLPEGLLTADGKSAVAIAVGTLPVGASKTFNVQLKADRKGDFANTAAVVADRNCTSQSTANLKVVAPDLLLEASGPGDAYICTPVPYTVKVTNKGDSPARDVMLMDSVSGSFAVESATGGGRLDKGLNRVAWNLGVLQPGESRTVTMQGSSKVEGQVQSRFSVAARCAQPKEVRHTLNLRGVAGVLTSLKDNCDPVMVGGTVTYTVTATNTGSRDATNLRYTIRLDDGMEYVGGEGVTSVRPVDARTVTFDPVPVLRKGGETATWNVTVRATGEGDKRFTADLMTNEFQNVPVSKSESTFFYRQNMSVVVAQ